MPTVRCMLAAAALVLAVSPSFAAPALSDDEHKLKTAGLPIEGPALLDFFRARSRTSADRDVLARLTRQLGDESAEAREHAVSELIGWGPLAIAALRVVVNDQNDLQTAVRARQCLEAIEGKSAMLLVTAAVRVTAARRPPGVVEVLLGYLPFADDQPIVDEIVGVLGVLTAADGKPDPALLKAIEDEVPIRRAIAAEALCRTGQPAHLNLVRKLLADPKPTVRMRVALALANQQDAAAIPILIELISDLPTAQRTQIENFLKQLGGEWAPTVTVAVNDDVSRRIRRDVWAAWWRNTDGAVILAEIRKRCLTDADQRKVTALLKELNDGDFGIRERAMSDLAAIGPLVLPRLKTALMGAEPEVVIRLQTCIRNIEKAPANPLPIAALKLLAIRKPAGSVEALLDYLPFAESQRIDEVVKTLTRLAVVDGQPEPALVRALENRVDARRTVAAEVLIRAAGEAGLTAARRLLKDPEPLVRQRVALAMAAAREREAIPVLIDLLGELPADQSKPAVDFLMRLAGDKVPKVAPGGDAASRQKCRDAWADWWKEHGERIDLSKFDVSVRLLGFTLLVHYNGDGPDRITEVNADGKILWKIESVEYPVDAQIVGEDRVLVAEYGPKRVTERDFTGKILWEKQTGEEGPIAIQRLANGNTLISTHHLILETSSSGKEVFKHALGGDLRLCGIYKAPGGEYVYLTSEGKCVWMDANGKEIKAFDTGHDTSWVSGIDVLANRHVVVPQREADKVVEFDFDGKAVWQVTATKPKSATRLATGNTLVTSFDDKYAQELDSAGKIVWQFKDTYCLYRARRR